MLALFDSTLVYVGRLSGNRLNTLSRHTNIANPWLDVDNKRIGKYTNYYE